MRAVRRLTVVVAFVTWIDMFGLLHSAQNFFKDPAAGSMPGWLVMVIGLALVSTVSTAVTGAIRLPLWPYLAMASALFVVVATVAAHQVALQVRYNQITRLGLKPRAVTVLTSAREASTGAVHFFFLVVAPLLLLAAGLFGWYYGPRTLFVPEPNHGA